MDQRRQLAFIVVSTVFFLIWMQVAPLLFPQFFPKPKAAKQPADEVAGLDDEDQDNGKAASVEKNANDRKDDGEPNADPVPPAELQKFAHKEITIGKGGFDAGYLLEVQLTSEGAAIDWAKLTDPQFKTLDRTDQIKVVGNPVVGNVGEDENVPQTFDTEIASINEALEPFDVTLSQVDWELVAQDQSSATFRYPSPKGDLEILKTYRVPSADVEKRSKSIDGYLLETDLVIRNLSQESVTTNYLLYGPVGMPLENRDNTLVFREAKIGVLEDRTDPDDVTVISMDARTLVKQHEKTEDGGKPVDNWRAPLRFAGENVQFFAALIYPQGNQLQDDNGDGDPDPYFEVTRPVLLERGAKNEWSDFTLAMESRELLIPAGKEVKHSFKTFFGPKRPALLRQLDAEEIMSFGWFGGVAKLMLWILEFFHHNIGLPYAFAIILLTVCVRGAMFPISKKQAVEAEKMRILAPELKKIQEKHKDNPEAFANAYREFQRKHNYHPMVGCLPALIQLPIFIGLYRSLYSAIDLRLAKFLWIDNLAAPDSLVDFGFTLPWPFGWSSLNLLPILTVLLFVLQQKLTVPPATSEEQEMQYRIMNIVTIAIGFAFYRVPAGLCLYFISSSLWGIVERSLLKRNPHTHEEALEDMGEGDTSSSSSNGKSKNAPKEEPAPKAPSWFDRLREAADQAKNATESQKSQRKYSKQKKKK
ncbi:MAG: membrane protein insertase YidC [Planctomycetaceae bacterium]|nr:membrane protein insertase YidC [Planctomycetaceae bacterium]